MQSNDQHPDGKRCDECRTRRMMCMRASSLQRCCLAPPRSRGWRHLARAPSGCWVSQVDTLLPPAVFEQSTAFLSPKAFRTCIRASARRHWAPPSRHSARHVHALQCLRCRTAAARPYFTRGDDVRTLRGRTILVLAQAGLRAVGRPSTWASARQARSWHGRCACTFYSASRSQPSPSAGHFDGLSTFGAWSICFAEAHTSCQISGC
jgi:hypothetical protein